MKSPDICTSDPNKRASTELIIKTRSHDEKFANHVAKNESKAIELYRKSTNTDVEQALYWYGKAAAQGYPEAIDAMVRMKQ